MVHSSLSFSDDDDEGELEILPPRRDNMKSYRNIQRNNNSQLPPKTSGQQPRLRFSGSSQEDPVLLDDDDDEKEEEESSIENNNNRNLPSGNFDADLKRAIALSLQQEEKQQQQQKQGSSPSRKLNSISTANKQHPAIAATSYTFDGIKHSVLPANRQLSHAATYNYHSDSSTSNSTCSLSVQDKKLPSRRVVSKKRPIMASHSTSSITRTSASNAAKRGAGKYSNDNKNDSDDSSSSSSSSDDSLKALKRSIEESKRLRRKEKYNTKENNKKKASNPSRSTTAKKSTAAKKSQASTLLQEMKATERRLLREAKQLQAKEDRQLAKEHAKQLRQQQRQAKSDEKMAAQQSKKRHVQECAQNAGKFSKDEIAVLIEPALLDPYGQDLENSGYLVQEYPSALQCHVVQWIRKEALYGGAKRAVQALLHGVAATGNDNHDQNTYYQHLDVIAIVVDNPEKFINLLHRENHEDEDDYPELESWLLGIQCGWKAAWRKPQTQPRIILLLDRVKETLDKLWVEHRKSKSRTPLPPTAEELYDAITWILIQFQVECVHCKTTEEITNHIRKVTRLLSEVPYVNQVTELECIKKIKAGVVETDTPFERSKDCWLRQLQQIPNISRQKALSLCCYYPTAYSLWKAYQDRTLSEEEKRLLTADMLTEKSSQPKLSSQLYTIMTCKDPKHILR
jgi:hypothetical protein